MRRSLPYTCSAPHEHNMKHSPRRTSTPMSGTICPSISPPGPAIYTSCVIHRPPPGLWSATVHSQHPQLPSRALCERAKTVLENVKRCTSSRMGIQACRRRFHLATYRGFFFGPAVQPMRNPREQGDVRSVPGHGPRGRAPVRLYACLLTSQGNSEKIAERWKTGQPRLFSRWAACWACPAGGDSGSVKWLPKPRRWHGRTLPILAMFRG